MEAGIILEEGAILHRCWKAKSRKGMPHTEPRGLTGVGVGDLKGIQPSTVVHAYNPNNSGG